MASPSLPTGVQIQMTYVDRPEVSEAYADLLGRVYAEGITLRMEFVVHRLDNAEPGQAITGKALTASRVVIPITSLLDTITKLQIVANQLQAGGMLRPIHDPGAQRPN
jgi:hypothetical protein